MKFKKSILLLSLSLISSCLYACANEKDNNSSSNISDNTSSITKDSSSSNSSSNDSSSSNEVDGYKRITSLEELSSSNKVLITAYDGSSLYGFTSENKVNSKDNSVYSWYFIGENLKEVNSLHGIKDITKTAIWNLTKVNDNYKFSLGEKDLYSYIDGTHYSIGLDSNKENNTWNVTMDSEGKAQMVSSSVYLEYYNGSFCGAKETYKDKAYVYFYTPSKIKIDGDKKDDINNNYPSTSDDSNWEGLDFSTYGNTFRGELQKLIKATKRSSISYSQCLSVGIEAATEPTDKNKFIPFYHASLNVTEGVTSSGALALNKKGSSVNREHTWPNSRGCGENGGPSSDPFIIRPTLSSENSSRGNSFYGLGGSAWDPASYGYEGARGESARIMFYTATCYFNTCGSGGSSSGNKPLELSNNPGDHKDEHTMGTLKELLEWNYKYPVTDMEKQINNYLSSKGLGRNPFVDHPEYANQIWDSNGIRTTKLNNISFNSFVNYALL